MTVGRLPGFNYYFPGLYSLIVPYHDIYDFYYSGHYATAAILICSLYSLTKRHPNITIYKFLFVAWIAFKLPYIWLYMTAVRTHYFIDFMSGICFGLAAFRLAEKLSYVFDVLVMGKRAEDRGLIFHKACDSCGWTVPDGR